MTLSYRKMTGKILTFSLQIPFSLTSTKIKPKNSFFPKKIVQSVSTYQTLLVSSFIKNGYTKGRSLTGEEG
jgi:hypothetical protein